jgi:hypothetical protein
VEQERRAALQKQRRLEENAKALAQWREIRAVAAQPTQRTLSPQEEAKAKEQKKAFMRRQKEILVRDRQGRIVEKKRNEKAEAQEKEERGRRAAEVDREEKKRKVQEMLEVEKEVRDKENSIRQEFEALWARSEIQAVFQPFDASLEVLFAYFAKKCAKSPLEVDELYLNGLLRLGQELKVVPDLCSKEVLIQVYRQVTKGKPGPMGLALQDFIQVLLRLSAICQSQLSLLESADSPPQSSPISQCPPSTVLALLTYLKVLQDPKRMIDRLKS